MDSEGPSQEFWRARSRASHCGSKHATCTISSKTWPSARCYLTCILTLMKLDAILNMPASDPRAHSTNCEWTLPSHLSASLASMCIHSFQKSPSCRPSDSTSLAAPRERTTKPNREPLSGLINDEADSSRDVPEAPLQPSGVTGDAQIRGRASALLRTCSSPLPGPPTPSSSFLPATGVFPSSLEHGLSLFIKKEWNFLLTAVSLQLLVIERTAEIPSVVKHLTTVNYVQAFSS